MLSDSISISEVNVFGGEISLGAGDIARNESDLASRLICLQRGEVSQLCHRIYLTFAPTKHFERA